MASAVQEALKKSVAKINAQTGFVQPTKTAPLVLDNSAYWVNKKELTPIPTNWNLAKLPSVLPSWFTPAETKDINAISKASGTNSQNYSGNRDTAGGGVYVPPNSKSSPSTFTPTATQTARIWSSQFNDYNRTNLNNTMLWTAKVNTPSGTVQSWNTGTAQNWFNEQFNGQNYNEINNPNPTPRRMVGTDANWNAIYDNSNNVFKGQTTLWSDWKPVQDNQSDDPLNPTNYYGSGLTEDQFNQLSLGEQKNIVDARVSNLEDRKNIYNQIQFAKELKERKDYDISQNNLKLEADRLQMQNEEIKNSEAIKAEQTKLANLRQNIGFMGTGGSSMQSPQRLDAYNQLLGDAQTTYANLVQLTENNKKLGIIWQTADAQQFEEQIRRINKDLTDSVDARILQEINNFSAEQISGTIDSPQKLFQLQNKILASIDQNVWSLTDKSINAMKLTSANFATRIATLQEERKEQLEIEKEERGRQDLFTKNSHTLNTDISKQTWYLVDWNGKPIMTAQWWVIPYKPELDKPIRSENSGIMLVPSLDASWKQIRTQEQLLPPDASNILDMEYKRAQINKLNAPEKVDNKPIEVGGVTYFKNKNWDYVPQVSWGWGWWQINLWEAPVDIWIPSVLWWNVKLAPTVWNMVMNAYNNLQQQGITLQIADSWRSNATQKQAYDSWKAWVAPPWQSFHEKWQAFDLSQTGWKMNDPKVFQALRDAGLQQLPWERWHWSYWEMWGWQTQQTSIDPNKFPQYVSYIETGKLPVGMKDNTPQSNQFISQALDGYIQKKEQEFNQVWLSIVNKDAFAAAVTDVQKIKDVNKAVWYIKPFEQSMDKLIWLVKEYWTELLPSNAKQQINSLVKNAQLQAKEIYNLWVLNWPDLSLMEAIISNPTAWNAKWNQMFWVSYVNSLENAKKTILDNAVTVGSNVWLWLKWETTQQPTTPTSWTGTQWKSDTEIWNDL